MLNIYEEYESPEEREATLALESAEIAMDRALLAADTAYRMKELKMREAELKFVQESGDDGCDFDRLCDYYEEAAEQTQDNSQGIISKAWAAIKSFFTNIKNKLFGKAEENIDPNKDYEVNKTDGEDVSKLTKAWQTLKGCLAHPFKNAVKIIATVGTILATVAILKKMVKGKDGGNNENNNDKGVVAKIKVKGTQLQQWIASLKKTNNDIINSTDAANKADDNSNESNEAKGFFKQIGQGITSLMNGFLDKVGLSSEELREEKKKGFSSKSAKANVKQNQANQNANDALAEAQGGQAQATADANAKANQKAQNTNESAEDFESLDSFEALFEEDGDFADTPVVDEELSELIGCL